MRARFPVIDAIIVCDNGSTEPNCRTALSAGATVVRQALFPVMALLPDGAGAFCPIATSCCLDGDDSCLVAQAVVLLQEWRGEMTSPLARAVWGRRGRGAHHPSTILATGWRHS